MEWPNPKRQISQEGIVLATRWGVERVSTGTFISSRPARSSKIRGMGTEAQHSTLQVLSSLTGLNRPHRSSPQVLQRLNMVQLDVAGENR
mmetsp:Transcript_49725/g.155614  ORF Transcript_49725/g.155614 Transcript_49725/m.155614 type:complete len:90 (+) Transcript_49725:716-985(+)